MTKEIKAAWIGGICAVIGGLAGILSINVNIENDDLMKRYKELQSENVKLNEINNELQNQIVLLTEENQALKSNLLTDNEAGKDELSNIDLYGKKVSIFDLETFKGYADWNTANEDRWYTDTYGNEYLGAHYTTHRITSREIENYKPTYLLDYKYSLCEGQIAWSKLSKDFDGSAWIEFYSGDECIYTTNPITADSRALTFSFSVEGVEKLTIVRRGTQNGYQSSGLCIIYPYLNLIE